MKHLLVCHGNWVAKLNFRPCCTKYEANLVLRVAELVYCVKGPTGACPFCEICRMFETKGCEIVLDRHETGIQENPDAEDSLFLYLTLRQ
jgi:hypothetical protein